MSTLHVVRGNLHFCPDCLDVFGEAGDEQKPCNCDRSAGVPLRSTGGDFPIPFHICLYCGLEVVSSGSRWSTFYCDRCRVEVLTLNDKLEHASWVSLPIGRHSLMHGRWPHARPFAAEPMVRCGRAGDCRSAGRRSANQAMIGWTSPPLRVALLERIAPTSRSWR